MATEQEIAVAEEVLANVIRNELNVRLESWRAELASLESSDIPTRMAALRGLIAIGENEMLTMLRVAPLATPEPQEDQEL